MNLTDAKKTVLYDSHVESGGKMVNFEDWALPIQYSSIIDEHNAVRNFAGIFDVSHMGEIDIIGKDAVDFVQNLVTNDVYKLEDNQVMYALMCYPEGGIVDDLLIYRISQTHLLLVINASNIEKDYTWMIENKNSYDVEISNISDTVSEIAIQGPNSQEILQKHTSYDLSLMKFFRCNKILIDDVECLVSRTGYTGEDGFEVYVFDNSLPKLWDLLLASGKEHGIVPAGLGCRDTLRFEATLPLYGHEISKDITPLEAGLGFFVKLDKEDFIGKDILKTQKENGLTKKVVGFELKDRGIPRHGYEVMVDDKKIGFVTTGYFSPTLKKSIGLALIDTEYSKLGSEIHIIIRNKKVKAEVISKKFYTKKYKK